MKPNPMLLSLQFITAYIDDHIIFSQKNALSIFNIGSVTWLLKRG